MVHEDDSSRGQLETGRGMGQTVCMDDRTRTEIEAAVFRRMVQHFRDRTDVQNIDVMETAGFCRNCLSKWYRAEAVERGVELEDAEARETIYGMPYADWKARYQK